MKTLKKRERETSETEKNEIYLKKAVKKGVDNKKVEENDVHEKASRGKRKELMRREERKGRRCKKGEEHYSEQKASEEDSNDNEYKQGDTMVPKGDEKNQDNERYLQTTCPLRV